MWVPATAGASFMPQMVVPQHWELYCRLPTKLPVGIESSGDGAAAWSHHQGAQLH